jgi:hypothetical protein
MLIFVPFLFSSIICESDSFTNLRHDMLYNEREERRGRGERKESKRRRKVQI